MRFRSFQKNLYFSVVGIFVLFALFFSIYQYNREKVYKIDIMQSRLQMYSYEMIQTLGDSILSHNQFTDYVKKHNVEGLRVTIIDEKGTVLLDSKQADVSKMHNHLKREEVRQAVKNGNGYVLKRESESTNETYFYSATLFRKSLFSASDKEGFIIIRIAIPYSAQLTESLRADNSYLAYAFILTILLGFVLYHNTSRISRHIGYLRRFAIEAEQGKELNKQMERKFPNDELGEISHTITALYWKLRHSEEDKQRIKRQLTQNAAHELKTPAASIHGYLESIIENPDMPADRRQHFLERCYAQSERMTKLLLDMAQLTKLEEAPNLTTSLSAKDNEENLTDIIPIIHNVLDDVALQLREKGIEVEFNAPARVIASSQLKEPDGVIYSIFRNLADNAITYATGATKITIDIRARVPKGWAVTFSDNGQGVESEHLPHLFERFYRVDKGRSRKLGGTGLGLAIVKNAVTAFGGTTTAEQTPGGGLTIHFSL